MPRRHLLLLLGAVGLILAVAWLWLPEEDGEDVLQPPPAPGIEVEEGADPAVAEAETGDSPVVAESTNAAADALPEERRIAVDSVENPPVVFRVVDQAGNPVGGIEIAVGMKVPLEKRAVRLGTATSSAEVGLAKVTINLPYFKRTVGNMADPELMADGKIPSLEKARVKFKWSERLDEPIEIRLPDFVWVDVEVHLPNGNLADTPTPVTVYWAKAGADDSGKWSNKRHINLAMHGARDRFPCGFGMDLNLWTHCPLRVNSRLTLTGPNQQNPRLDTLILTLGDLFPHFRGQFFLPDGNPAANRELAWHEKQNYRPKEDEPQQSASYAKRPRWKDNLTTDADGWIEMTLSSNEYTQRYDRNWTFVLRSAERGQKDKKLDEDGTIQVSVAVPLVLSPDEYWNPGELQLRELKHPFLASGTVQKTNGSSAPASLTIYEFPTDPKSRANAKILWHGLAQQGKFEAFGPAPASGQIRVTASGYQYLGEELRAAVGTHDLAFIRQKGANVRGHVLLDEDIAWHLIDVRMQQGRHKSLGVGNTIWVNYVRNGSHWLELKHGKFPLWRVENLLIEGSGDIYPTQLDGVDLRGQIHQWKVKFLDENGDAFPHKTKAEFKSPDGRHDGVKIELSGYATQLTSNEVQEMVAGIKGYEVVKLSWPIGSQPIQLRKVIK